MFITREQWDAQREARRERFENPQGYLDTLAESLDEFDAHANIDAAPTRVLPEMVECDCGHECGAAMVMSASMGTSCPDCYDTMSN